MYRYRYICVVQSCISGHEGWMTQTWFRLLNFHNLFWSDTKNWLRVFCVNLVSKGAIIFEMIRLKKIFHILLCFFLVLHSELTSSSIHLWNVQELFILYWIIIDWVSYYFYRIVSFQNFDWCLCVCYFSL